MAAVPAPYVPARTPEPMPHRKDVMGGCRDYAAPGQGEDAARMVASLRYLKSCLDAWTLARVEMAAGLGRGPSTAGNPVPDGMPLGPFVRRFSAWLEAHPERTGEPMDWLIRQVLMDHAGAAAQTRPARVPVAPEDPDSRSSSS